MGVGLGVERREMSMHKFLCFVLWGVWGVGLCFTGASLLYFRNENHWLFWNIAFPYNRFVQLISLVPLEPIFCILTISDRKKAEQPYGLEICFSVITFLFWVMYITLSVWWTGGV